MRSQSGVISIDAGVRKFFCGPESFTPDLQPCVGEAPELKNYFVAAGLNSIGILTGGGLGRVMAHWIINGRPDVDVIELRKRVGMVFQRSNPFPKAIYENILLPMICWKQLLHCPHQPLLIISQS